MTIPVYKGYDKFQQVGTVTISFNRIVSVDITYTVPVSMGYVEKQVLYIQEGKPLPTQKFSMSRETQFSFTIKRLSKADFGYRNAKLTHEIISNDLLKYFDTKFFIKLSFLQRQKIAFNLKKFFWQTQDFKSHIYNYIVTSLISAALGVVGTLIVVKPSDKKDNPGTQTQTQQPSDTTTRQPIHRTTKSLSDVSSVDTTKQKTQTK